MTLPQYLDPFTTETNAGDNSEALSITLAVKYGRLPYSKLGGSMFALNLT